jgi:hypothetical protein
MPIAAIGALERVEIHLINALNNNHARWLSGSHSFRLGASNNS